MTTKKKQNVYFTQDTENAIIEYNKCENPTERNIIYTRRIHPAFYKLAEIMIHRFKFYNFDVPHEDVKHEVVTFLHEKLCKYKEDSGKAFSYFSIVAKNYLIAENNKNYYQYKSKHGIEVIDAERNVINEKLRGEMIDEQNDFIDLFVDIMEKYLASIFPKQRDIQIADSVLYLFKTRENIENYNKKAIYILIRERTGVKSQYITNVISRVKVIYSKLYREYCDGVNISDLSWYDIQDIIDD
jgi:uncharacterized pyridoxamine 5'-phosphate oxidase family protein